MSYLTLLENFDCEVDSGSVGLRWEKWKRGLDIYLDAANIATSSKKRATLLHLGGLGLQEIYHNIPGAHILATTESTLDVYQIAITKLDEYFSPKQSKIYERHIFRLMKQESEEKFEKFLVRLRKQADKCKFADKEERLIDQIVEKCSSSELRKKILKGGDNVTLDDIILEVNILESVGRQMEEFNKNVLSNHINKINTYNNKRGLKTCTRCGSYNHHGNDFGCPARKVKCHKCGITGHFKKFCLTKNPLKRKTSYNGNMAYSKKKQRNTDDKKNEATNYVNEKADYIFHIDEDCMIDCKIGGVNTKLLIDSGSKCNLLTEKTWQIMKRYKAKVFDQEKSPNKTFLPYGSNRPLQVIGSFKSTIIIDYKEATATFYVIKNGTKDLLGKDSAISLGVLRIGVETNFIQNFPKFKDVLIDIPIDETVKPVCQPYRRIPIPLEDKVNMKIRELRDSDIIEEVREPSKWVSPIVPVIKENGEVRICVDMRRANQAIIRENHPLPTMDQLLPHFKKATVFSRLDIKDAFHQIEIHMKSRHITTFISNKGMYRYKRLMFGISCAPEIFQKVLERILLKCEGSVNFIDDIIVFGRDLDEHDMRLKQTLEVLDHNNVLLNRSKCVYRISKINFLGHELSPQGIKPLDKYIKSICSFRVPETIEELQSFLELVNFVGKWIANLATLTEPLRKLLKLKNHSKAISLFHVWHREQDDAFANLKKSLCEIRCLGYYDPKDKTQVIADASPVGLGAILIQVDTKGPRVIAYGNKSLTDCEKRYCQTEKEALALVWAVEHFNIYLYGKTFELISDHKPLEVIFGRNSKPCARIERWVLRLQSYDYKVIYKPGKSNIADPLSKLCNNSPKTNFDNPICENQIIEYAAPNAVPVIEIDKQSALDNEICKVKKGLIENVWDPSITNFKMFQNELCCQGNIILKGNRLVIPMELRNKVLEAAHEGHPGIVAMKSRLRTKVWWPKIDKDAEDRVKKCKSCTLVSAPNPPHSMKRRELPMEPWVEIAMDLLGPLPSSDDIFVCIDYYSRYKELKITKNISSSEIIKILKEIFSRLGYPVSITADNGKQFTSFEFKSYLKECGITLFNSIPYWPQQNGEVERQNRSILKRLRISQIEKRNWKEDLFYYLMMYNSTPHTVTGKSPSELFYGRQFRDKVPCLKSIENQHLDEETRERDTIQKEVGKQYADRKRRATENHIAEGDKVFVRNFQKERKLTSNFSSEPHTVTQNSPVTGDVTIQNDETGQELRRNVVHLKKIGGKWKVVTDKDTDEDKDIRDE